MLVLKGKVSKGVQVASGIARKCHDIIGDDGDIIKKGQYRGGTIKLQRWAMRNDPMGRKKYLDLADLMEEMEIYNGTINVKLSDYLILDPKKCEWVVRNLYWDFHTIESFTYARAKLRIVKSGKEYDCFLYRPHCSKLSEHPRDIVEVLAPKVNGLKYSDEVEILIDKEKVKDIGVFDKIKLKFSGGDSPELDI